MNKGLKNVLSIILITVLALILIGGFNILIDPFYHYHGPLDGKKPYMYNAYYQTTGAARHFTYDSVIVGTSLSENIRISWLSENGCNYEKFTYPSASLKDYGMILNAVFESGNDVKNVIMDISDIQLTANPGTVYTTEAEYINDASLLNDYNYIWNMDVTKQSVFRCADMLSGKINDHDSDYTWENPEFFTYLNCRRDAEDSRNMILAAQAEGSYTYFDESTISNHKDNLNEITGIISAHPETTFNIYIPPFSMLYWELQTLDGRKDWILNVYADTINELTKYNNVKVYSFIDQYWIIEDLDLYRDTGHYAPSINKYIVESILNGENETSYQDFEKNSKIFSEFLNNYDFETLWIYK